MYSQRAEINAFQGRKLQYYLQRFSWVSWYLRASLSQGCDGCSTSLTPLEGKSLTQARCPYPRPLGGPSGPQALRGPGAIRSSPLRVRSRR